MAKKKIRLVLCDSNVLFSLLRGDQKTKTALEKIGNSNICFSIITVAEAYSGSSKLQFGLLKNFFSNYKIVPITRESSEIFNGLIHSHFERHSKWIPDALIASSAISNGLELFTYNRKDFDFISELKLYKP